MGSAPSMPRTEQGAKKPTRAAPLKTKQNAKDETAKQVMRRKLASTLGIIRLDYNYPPAPGDIDSPDSYEYDVFYRVVPGLTFEMCQSGRMTEDVKAEFQEAIRYFEQKSVSGITGDCGFMMHFQPMARALTKKPVFLSALAQLPAVTCSFGPKEKIAIMTANGDTLTPMQPLINDECGVDVVGEDRFLIIGCQDVPGFEAVALGTKVDVQSVMPGMVAKAKRVLAENPDVRAFLMECTELPPYSDALRKETGLPVYDAITCSNFFMTGFQDNPRFGLNDWQESWDRKQHAYTFGEELTAAQKEKLVNKTGP